MLSFQPSTTPDAAALDAGSATRPDFTADRVLPGVGATDRRLRIAGRGDRIALASSCRRGKGAPGDRREREAAGRLCVVCAGLEPKFLLNGKAASHRRSDDL